MARIEENIRDKTAKIAVIGLGYVGMPLAVSFAEVGFRVLGFDIQRAKTEAINRCKPPIPNIDMKQLDSLVRGGFFKATSDVTKLSEANVVCICVPTPITRAREPDLSHVIHVTRDIAHNLRPGQVIILESTTYPGTTREVILPILEGEGLVLDKDFYLAFSPRRVDPGNTKYNVKNIPKIVGGLSDRSTALAVLLYAQVADRVVPASSPEVAEMAKVFEDVFRSVNIALVNEMALLSEKMGVDMWEVIEAASTKPFGYMPFYPGPGIGGHCVPTDPYYLASKAREYDFPMRFIELAAQINVGMPYHVIALVNGALNGHGKSLKGSKVLVLGVAYKKDSRDSWASPSLKIIDLLQERGADVSYSDPYIPKIESSTGSRASVRLSDERLAAVDCVVIATDHSCFDLEQIVAWSPLVVDTRGATSKLKKQANIVRLGESGRYL